VTTASARLLVGRTIVAVDLQSSRDSSGVLHHEPRITLDNGAVIVFHVSEDSDGGEYGVTPLYCKRRAK